MKYLIFFITLCLPAVCFGQVDGRGVICEREDTDGKRMEYFEFGVNSVTQHYFFAEQDSFKIGKAKSVRYSVTSSEVIWYDKRLFNISEQSIYGDTTHTLSRKTGILVETANDYPSHLRRYECQIFADSDSYYSELLRIRDSRQEEYDKEREGNLF